MRLEAMGNEARCDAGQYPARDTESRHYMAPRISGFGGGACSVEAANVCTFAQVQPALFV